MNFAINPLKCLFENVIFSEKLNLKLILPSYSLFDLLDLLPFAFLVAEIDRNVMEKCIKD